jgi:hypothetical protein
MKIKRVVAGLIIFLFTFAIGNIPHYIANKLWPSKQSKTKSVRTYPYNLMSNEEIMGPPLIWHPTPREDQTNKNLGNWHCIIREIRTNDQYRFEIEINPDAERYVDFMRADLMTLIYARLEDRLDSGRCQSNRISIDVDQNFTSLEDTGKLKCDIYILVSNYLDGQYWYASDGFIQPQD